MKLRDINIRIENLNLSNAHGLRPAAVEDLYLKKLKSSVETQDVAKVNVYLSREKAFKIEDLIADTLSCSLYFDAEGYFNLKSSYERKLKLLDAILEALLQCSEAKGWNKDCFLDAYNACLKDQLRNEWWYKNKLFKSPDKKYLVGLYNIFDLDGYTISLVLFDEQENELGRRNVFRDSYPSFALESASWENTNDTFCFKFKGPKKIFTTKVKEIIDNVEYNLPIKTSDYFK